MGVAMEFFLTKNLWEWYHFDILKRRNPPMKRIKAACLEQTVHFQMKEELRREEAVKYVQAEYEHYLAQMDRSRTRYQILEKTEQPDGSIIVKLKKQYNSYDCSPYMN